MAIFSNMQRKLGRSEGALCFVLSTKLRALFPLATSRYWLTVRATDGGGRYDEELLVVNIDDVNDNFPVFIPG